VSRLWAALKALPGLVWAVLAALGGLAALLLGARRRGAQVGAAKATARAETEHVRRMVNDAENAAKAALVRRRDRGTTAESQVAADASARESAAKLRADILRRVRR